MDYFRALELDQRLSLDAVALQRQFHNLCRRWHPDLVSTRPAFEQAEALERTALLNDAFRTLKDPVLRGEYVLAQNGLEAATQRGHDVPQELLEEVLELNEALAEADKRQIEQLLPRFQDALDTANEELKQQYAAYDAAPGVDALRPIRATLNRRKYLWNLVRDAERALER